MLCGNCSAAPALYHSLDISRIANREGENTLLWVPNVVSKESPVEIRDFNGTIPPLSLEWMD